MWNTTGTNENHAVCCIIGLDVRFQVIALNALNVLLWSEDGAAERLALESGGMQVIEDYFLELLVNLFLFAQNNITFALNRRGVKLGVLENIRENVDGGRDVRVEGFGIVNGVFSLSKREWIKFTRFKPRLTEV
jgi:hypothetical protein